MAVPPGQRPQRRREATGRSMAVAVGVAGLAVVVIYAGAADIWLRYAGAKLPATRAVAVTPIGEVLATGAAQVTGFAVLGAIAMLVAYLVDRRGTLQGQAISVTVLGAAAVAAGILRFDPSWKQLAPALGATAFWAVAATLLAVATTNSSVKARLEERRAVLAWLAAASALLVAGGLTLSGDWIAAVALAVTAAIVGGLVRLALVPAGSDSSGQTTFWQRAGEVVRTLAGPVAVGALAAVVGVALDEWSASALVVLAGILMAALLALATRNPALRWRALSVFMAVLVFGSGVVAAGAWESPRLAPMAVQFTREAGGGAQVGVYVAETSDDVYLGAVRHCRRNDNLVLRPGKSVRGRGELLRFPRGDVAATAVGSETALTRALNRGPELVEALRARVPRSAGLDAPGRAQDRAPPPPEPAAKPGCATEGPIDLKVRATEPVSPEEAGRVAARFRPVLRFDKSERWRPLNVDRLFAEARGGMPVHRICTGRKCQAVTDLPALASAVGGEVRHFDFDGQRLGGRDYRTVDLERCRLPRRSNLQDCDRGGSSAIYYHVTRANRRTYADYWWFLRFNRFSKHAAAELCRNRSTLGACSDHEGDWEGVTVVSAINRPDRIEFVNLASHSGVFRYSVHEITRRGQRPVVYVAAGTHAAYPANCPRKCKQSHRILGLRLPEENNDGGRGWGRNGPTECDRSSPCLLPLPRNSWGRFAGRWGSRECGGSKGRCRLGNGPRSPRLQQRYKFPWCFTANRDRELKCDQ